MKEEATVMREAGSAMSKVPSSERSDGDTVTCTMNWFVVVKKHSAGTTADAIRI